MNDYKNINVLDNDTIYNIASGEAIKNKSSIIKELIENSIDSKATQIKIILHNKINDKIIVSDNGIGMTRKDSIICTNNYTTSKINSYKDIFSLNSLGFRGEALHSIRTISKLKILTRTRKDLLGTEICWIKGKIEYIKDVGMPYGTQVEVSDIFYNMPERKKFLNNKTSENADIIKVFKSIILPFFKINFIFYINNKICNLNIFSLQNKSHSERIKRVKLILNKKHKKIFILNNKFDNISITIYIMAPLENIYSRGYIYTYINKRHIIDRELNKIIKSSFSNFIKLINSYLLICFIKIFKNKINPNTCPQKINVLIKDKENFYNVIKSIIYNNMRLNKSYYNCNSYYMKTNINKNQKFIIKLKDDISKINIYKDHLDLHSHFIRYIGQVKLTFLLFEYKDKMVIIDQHAAAELILFKKIIKRQECTIFEMEKNIVPVKINMHLPSNEWLLLYKNIKLINKYGLYITFLNKNNIIINGYAFFFINYNIEYILNNIIEILEEKSSLKEWIFEFIKKASITKACYKSLRAGTEINTKEACYLLKELDGVVKNTHCPHGRPIIKFIEIKEIFNWFGRNLN